MCVCAYVCVYTHVCVCVFVCSEVAGKELAAELVYSFLLPEVEKQTTRERGESTYNYICDWIERVNFTPTPLLCRIMSVIVQ